MYSNNVFQLISFQNSRCYSATSNAALGLGIIHHNLSQIFTPPTRMEGVFGMPSPKGLIGFVA